MLELGRSVPWQDALFKCTGERELSAKPILEYFAPLHDWLKTQNKNQQCGWPGNLPPSPPQGFNEGLVILVSIGALAITIVVVILMWNCCRESCKKKADYQPLPQ